MKDIFIAIQQRLAESGKLKYIDEDWGQLDDYSPHPPTQFPLALVDVTDALFEEQGKDRQQLPVNRQTATTVVTITVADLKLTNTSHRAPQRQKENAWEIWDLIDDIHKVLHGWKPTDRTGALIRTSLKRVVRDDGIQEYRISYSLGISDT